MNNINLIKRLVIKISLETEMRIIENFVEKYRTEHCIEPTSGVKPELSCEAFGECYNLLYRQLITTVNSDGSWEELESPEVRELILDQIEKDSKYVFK